MELPIKKVKAETKNPKSLIIYSPPKVGKTTLVANLDNALIIDLEKGSKFLDALKVEINTWEEMVDLIKSLREANKEAGGFKYKYGVIDTVSKLEDIAKPYALQLYQKTPMGKKYTGDILALPQGAGYGYLRTAMENVVNFFRELFDTIILIGHLKDKIVAKDGQEVACKEISLTGKLSTIIPASVDAVGYLSRDRKSNLTLSFQAGDELAAGARPDHLKGQIITVTETQADGSIKYFWDRIFLPEN